MLGLPAGEVFDICSMSWIQIAGDVIVLAPIAWISTIALDLRSKLVESMQVVKDDVELPFGDKFPFVLRVESKG